MNEIEDKKLDTIISSLIKETPLNSPSVNFTDTVMHRIELLNSAKSTTYQPLISKTSWLLIVIASLMFMLLLITNINLEETNWFTVSSVKKYIDFQLPSFSFGYKFPRIFLYGLSCFLIMLLIQIPILKNYFNNSLKQ